MVILLRTRLIAWSYTVQILDGAHSPPTAYIDVKNQQRINQQHQQES